MHDSDLIHIPMPDIQGGDLPSPEMPDSVEIDESALEVPELSVSLQPLNLKDCLRIVVFGGDARLHDRVKFAGSFQKKPVGQVSYPDSDFEAGICAASADVLIFDMSTFGFGDILNLLDVLESYVPRAVVVVLLEPGASPDSLPQCGIHLAVPTPFTEESVAKQIEYLMFGNEEE